MTLSASDDSSNSIKDIDKSCLSNKDEIIMFKVWSVSQHYIAEPKPCWNRLLFKENCTFKGRWRSVGGWLNKWRMNILSATVIKMLAASSLSLTFVRMWLFFSSYLKLTEKSNSIKVRKQWAKHKKKQNKATLIQSCSHFNFI